MPGDFSHVAVDWNNNCAVDGTTIVSTEVISGSLGRLSLPRHFLHPIPFMKTLREEAGVATNVRALLTSTCTVFRANDFQRAP